MKYVNLWDILFAIILVIGCVIFIPQRGSEEIDYLRKYEEPEDQEIYSIEMRMRALEDLVFKDPSYCLKCHSHNHVAALK